MKREQNRSGFTLLELLMVVVIIGILASLAIPALFRAGERSRSTEVTTVFGQLRDSSKRYCVENNGTPPPGYAALDIENPTLNPDFTARWTLSAFGGAVSSCSPFTYTQTATRAAGPCINSTVVITEPPAVAGGTLFTYTWVGACA